MDVTGNVVDSLYGAGGTTTQIKSHAAYDPNSSYLMYMKSTSVSGTTTYQDLAYQWYAIGNVYNRASNPTTDNANTLSETFAYDLHNRLLSSTVTNAAGTQTPLTQTYDSVGDIASKSDVGTYGYTGTGGGPHAVKTAGTNTYVYDANGNMTSRSVTVNGTSSSETMTWNSDNLPTAINQDANNYSNFSYGPDKHRYKQVAMNAGSSETTLYLGGLEIITDSSGTWYRHTITAYGKPVLLETLSTNTSGAPKEDQHYLLNDHLGSVDTVVKDSDGTVIPRESFDAFGQRRDKSTWHGAMNATDLANARKVTHHGFTHHEHLDNLAGLVHAGGRVLDSVTGRFLSVDPMFQAPTNSQSMNPYSYVMNNPLSMVDPSGYCGTDTSTDQCQTSGDNGAVNRVYKGHNDTGTMDHMGGMKRAHVDKLLSAAKDAIIKYHFALGEKLTSALNNIVDLLHDSLLGNGKDGGQSAGDGQNKPATGADVNAPAQLSKKSIDAINNSDGIDDSANFQKDILDAAQKAHIDPNLLVGIGFRESTLDPTADGGGLFQIHAAKQKELGLSDDDMKDTAKQIQAVANNLAKEIRTFSGNADLAIAAWTLGNAATKNALKAGGMDKVRSLLLSKKHPDYGRVGPEYIDKIKEFEDSPGGH